MTVPSQTFRVRIDSVGSYYSRIYLKVRPCSEVLPAKVNETGPKLNFLKLAAVLPVSI